MKDTREIDPELWQSLQDLEAGILAPEQREALMRELAESAEARALYLEYFELSALITAEARTHLELQALPRVARVRRMPNRWVALAVAACLLIGLLLVRLVPPSEVPLSADTGKAIRASAVAGTVWEVEAPNGETASSGSQITAGSTVHVSSGTLRLLHPSGAQFMLQGPSRVHFAHINRPQVQLGWLWLDTKDTGEAFELETPELLLRDIGTRFGVRVPGRGPAEVHLFEGRVDAYAKQSNRKLLELLPERQGVVLQPGSEPAGISLAPDPFATAEQLMAVGASYETVILSQGPLDYWRMEATEDGQLRNRIAGGQPAGRHASIEVLADGTAGSLPGLGKDNASLRFDRSPAWAPVSLGSSPLHRGVILRESFSHTGALHQTLTGPSEAATSWVASPAFGGDGQLYADTTGTATLAFTPIHGRVYTLDASFENLQSEPGIDTWVGLGFASGQSVSSYIYGLRENRFLEGQTTGRAWMLYRASGSPLDHQACLGTTGKNGGIADAPGWTGWQEDPGGSVDLRVVLDTTGGEGQWSAQWLAKRPTDESYREVRPKSRLLNEEIHSIGIAVGKEGLSGRIRSFSLKATGADPDPQDWLATSPARLDRRGGSVSLWIQPHAQRVGDQIIWSAGGGPTDDAMHLRLATSGQLGFFIENDRFDVLLTSPTPLTPGSWHHVVACWDEDRVELHVDGQIMAADIDLMPLPPKALRELHLGSGALGSGFSPLQATVDEVAVWQRPLTAPEIRLQHEAARGELTPR